MNEAIKNAIIEIIEKTTKENDCSSIYEYVKSKLNENIEYNDADGETIACVLLDAFEKAMK